MHGSVRIDHPSQFCLVEHDACLEFGDDAVQNEEMVQTSYLKQVNKIMTQTFPGCKTFVFDYAVSCPCQYDSCSLPGALTAGESRFDAMGKKSPSSRAMDGIPDRSKFQTNP